LETCGSAALNIGLKPETAKFSGQWAVFSVFYSPEARAGKTQEIGNLRQSRSTNRTIHFFPKKPRPKRLSPGGAAPL